jgi:Holliday junction resolvase RusA-like endonuclease
MNRQYRVAPKGKLYLTPEAKRWRQHVHNMCILGRVKPIEGQVTVVIKWYRAQARGDIDGRFKLLLDALESKHPKWMKCMCGQRFGAYKNDSQIRTLRTTWSDEEKGNPRMVINVRPWRDDG